MEGDPDLDHTLKGMALRAGRPLPLGLEHLVDLEEELLVPERDGPRHGRGDAILGGAGRGDVGLRRVEPATGMHAYALHVGTVHVEERAVGLDQVQRREAGARSVGCRVVLVGGEPDERVSRRRIVQPGDDEMREPVAKREWESRGVRGGHETSPVLPRDPVVSHVYTGRVRISHHELDAFGRVYPAVYLRHLAAIAVDASTAVGFDADWYAAAGVHWLVRRTTFDLHTPATVGAELVVRTWVEDFRRVRSQRRYEVRTPDGAPILDAVTDWVLVESASGRLRRIPAEMERRFGTAAAPGASRSPWTAPPVPAAPIRGTYPVRYTDLDSLMHVNNAAYVDLLFQAALDALGSAGWGLDALAAAGAVPLCVAGDVEYLDAARFGDGLAVTTWFTPTAETLDVHQTIARTRDERGLVRCTVRWAWRDPLTRMAAPTPRGLADAVSHAVAA